MFIAGLVMSAGFLILFDGLLERKSRPEKWDRNLIIFFVLITGSTILQAIEGNQ